MKEDGGPAFPLPAGGTMSDGLSIRDYFAAKTLQGMLSSFPTWGKGESGESTWQTLSRKAYESADAMLKERSKP